MLKKVISAAIAGSILSGCANIKPVEVPADAANTQDKARAKVEERWTEPALTREGKPMVVLYTPYSIPEKLSRKSIEATMEPNATVKDLAAVLGNLGVSIIIADKDAGDATFFLPKYNGSLGRLLSAVSKAADVWFTYQDGVIIVSSKERIGLSIPQDEALAKKVSDGLSTIGLSGALNSADAGMVALDLKYSQYTKARNFLKRMTQNSALVTLQVAIVTVDVSQNDSQGIDWSKLQISLGKNSSSIFDPNGGAAVVTTTNGTTTTNSTTTTTTSGSTSGSTTTGTTTDPTTTIASTSLPAYLNTALITGSGARLALSNSLFSLAGFVNFLGGYGTTETLQNVMLKTTTGNKVELKSVTQIPYVSGIGVATTGTTGANGSVGLLGSAKTSTANDGLTLKLTPAFDSAANTITLNMDLSIQSVISFNNLSAGNQIGDMSQPTTADRSFNDILRLRPGETVVVGGITYESLAKNFSGPLAARDTRWESKTLQTKKQTMFIVIRPTVRTFGNLDEQASEELLQEASAPTVVHATEKPNKSHKGKKVATDASQESVNE